MGFTSGHETKIRPPTIFKKISFYIDGSIDELKYVSFLFRTFGLGMYAAVSMLGSIFAPYAVYIVSLFSFPTNKP